MAADAALWIGLAFAAHGSTWRSLIAAALIGAGPMHDLLIFGHDGVHGSLSRNRLLNELGAFFTHALAFTSSTAHRAFHLEHHRYTHCERDPEFRLLSRLGGARGASYLIVPAIAPLTVAVHGLRRPLLPGDRARVARDLLGIAALHFTIAAIVGARSWALFCVAPLLLGLGPAFFVRSICEHHGRPSRDVWLRARTLDVAPGFEIFWTHINYHLEHHLFPNVPVRHMRALRAALAGEYAQRGIAPDRGYLSTALRLLRERRHFG